MDNQLLQSNGAINPLAYANDPKTKLENLKKLFPPAEYNIVLFSQFLMNSLPEGITLMPQFVEVTDEDLWDEKNAEGVKLKSGHVMLKSEKVINIGQAVGIRLEKFKEEEIVLNKIPHLRIEYLAHLRLPDGTEIVSSPVGKTLPMLTKDGSMQAHIHESVDRKAKRNAIKELLSIPTQMKREDAKRLWVCVRAVITDSSNYNMKRIEQNAVNATALLYDSAPEPTKFITAEEFKQKILDVKTLSDWETLRDTLSQDLFPDEIVYQGLRAILGKKYRDTFGNGDKL